MLLVGASGLLRALHRVEEQARIERLHERPLRAESFGHLELEGTGRRDRDHRRRWIELAQDRDELESVHVGHLKIGDDDVDSRLQELAERLLAARGDDGVVPDPSENRLDQESIGLLVIDDQDTRHGLISGLRRGEVPAPAYIPGPSKIKHLDRPLGRLTLNPRCDA